MHWRIDIALERRLLADGLLWTLATLLETQGLLATLNPPGFAGRALREPRLHRVVEPVARLWRAAARRRPLRSSRSWPHGA